MPNSAVAGDAPALPSPLAADPVFAAIAAHERVIADVCEYVARVVTDERVHGVGPSGELEREGELVFDRDKAALMAVIVTVPTTSAGMVLWAGHLARKDCFGDGLIDTDELVAVLATVSSFAEAGHA